MDVCHLRLPIFYRLPESPVRKLPDDFESVLDDSRAFLPYARIPAPSNLPEKVLGDSDCHLWKEEKVA